VKDGSEGKRKRKWLKAGNRKKCVLSKEGGKKKEKGRRLGQQACAWGGREGKITLQNKHNEHSRKKNLTRVGGEHGEKTAEKAAKRGGKGAQAKIKQ